MAAPPNYNSTPLTPVAGGVIHAMHGGGDGGAPPGYSGISIMQTNPGVIIKAYEGGGQNDITNDPSIIAVGAVATKEADNMTITPTAIATATATATATGTATPVNVTPKKVPNTQTDEPSSKKITLNGHTITISKPWDLTEGSKESEALAWFGVDKTSDEELKKEVLQALFDGVCDTDKPLIMVLECEPIRRLVQSLAEKLLGNLTRPVVKKTPAVVAAQELQSATLMSFNVFKNQCKTKTAKDYIENSKADIVCTQKDTKTDFTNYTEIKACGVDDDTARVYLKKGIPSAKGIECITVAGHSAVLFTYQGVTIVNMGSADPALLEEVLKKDPHIILGSVDGLLEKGYIRAKPTGTEPSNKDLITADAIWYKKDQDLFELKDLTIPNLIVSGDQYTDPVSCSYSDHNPITVVIEFKKTIKKLSSNADQAAEAAAKGATIASETGSRAMEAITESDSVGSTSVVSEEGNSALTGVPPEAVLELTTKASTDAVTSVEEIIAVVEEESATSTKAIAEIVEEASTEATAEAMGATAKEASEKIEIPIDIKPYVEQFVKAYQANFDIASENARDAVFAAMLHRMRVRINMRKTPVYTTAEYTQKYKANQASYTGPIQQNASSGSELDLDVLRTVIRNSTLNDEEREKLLSQLDTIYVKSSKELKVIDTHKLGLFVDAQIDIINQRITNRINQEPITTFNDSMEWYKDFIIALDTYTSDKNNIIAKLMLELDIKTAEYAANYYKNHTINKEANNLLFKTLSDDKLDVLLLQIQDALRATEQGYQTIKKLSEFILFDKK